MKRCDSTFALLAVALLTFSSTPVRGFFPKARSVASTSAASNEAIAIFQKKYPKKGELKNNALKSLGVPKRDVDGTLISKEGSSGRRLTDIDETQARATFEELAKLYGEDNALTITKILPFVLAFNKKYFAASLSEFQTIFGDEEAKEMVIRNPGLLAIKPEDAAKSDDQTMQFSYILAATRPVGALLLGTLLTLLLIPAIENVTEIPIRVNLLTSITGNTPEEVVRVFQQSSDPLGVFRMN